jgi:hypothetical protein
MTTFDYPYKPKLGASVGALLISSMVAVGFWSDALTNDRGLIIDGVIHLSAHGATVFYWVGAVLMGSMTLMGGPVLVLSALRGHRIVLTSTTLAVPKAGYSSQATTIPLTDIQRLWLQTTYKQQLLHIYHRGGKLTVVRSWLPSNAAFEALCSELARHVPADESLRQN